MMTAVGYLAVIVLEAWPVYAVLQARMEGTVLTVGAWLWLAGGLAAAAGVSAVAIIVPLRTAVRRVGEVEL